MVVPLRHIQAKQNANRADKLHVKNVTVVEKTVVETHAHAIRLVMLVCVATVLSAAAAIVNVLRLRKLI